MLGWVWLGQAGDIDIYFEKCFPIVENVSIMLFINRYIRVCIIWKLNTNINVSSPTLSAKLMLEHFSNSTSQIFWLDSTVWCYYKYPNGIWNCCRSLINWSQALKCVWFFTSIMSEIVEATTVHIIWMPTVAFIVLNFLQIHLISSSLECNAQSRSCEAIHNNSCLLSYSYAEHYQQRPSIRCTKCRNGLFVLVCQIFANNLCLIGLLKLGAQCLICTLCDRIQCQKRLF